jgi:hypothetical protein
MPFSAACSDEQKIPVSVTYTTASGNPAAVDGDTVVDVVSGDGTFERTGAHSGFLVSGLAGDTVYSVSADADLGAGVVTLSDSGTLTVTSAQAASIGVTLGAPVPK